MNLYDKLLKANPDIKSRMITEEDRAKRKTLNSGSVTFNLLCSGKIDVAMEAGSRAMFPAPSAYCKSLIALMLVRDAQKKGMNCIYLCPEKAFDYNLAKNLGVDTSPKILPIVFDNSLENIESYVVNISDGMSREERENTFIVIDSWHVLETTKAVSNAMEAKDVSDMTKTRKLNRLANLMLYSDITFFTIGATYTNVGGYGDPQSIGGGTKIIYISDYVIMGSGKSKVKDSEKVQHGIIISAKSHKTRGGKEGTKLQYRVDFDGGLNTFFGLLDDALESGVVIKPKNGRYSRPCVEADKDWKEDDIYCTDFWLPIFKGTKFKDYLENKYSFKQSTYRINSEEMKDIS